MFVFKEHAGGITLKDFKVYGPTGAVSTLKNVQMGRVGAGFIPGLSICNTPLMRLKQLLYPQKVDLEIVDCNGNKLEEKNLFTRSGIRDLLNKGDIMVVIGEIVLYQARPSVGPIEEYTLKIKIYDQ